MFKGNPLVVNICLWMHRDSQSTRQLRSFSMILVMEDPAIQLQWILSDYYPIGSDTHKNRPNLGKYM